MRADENRRAIAADINNIHEMMRAGMLAVANPFEIAYPRSNNPRH